MGSAGMALGPDGKPLKRQEKKIVRGMGRPFRGMVAGMAGRPMRGGPMMMNHGYGRPVPYGMGPMGGGFGNRPMPFAGPMGYGPNDQNISFFNTPQPVPPPMGDARTGQMQSGQQQATPSATTVGKGTVGGQGTTNNQTESNNTNQTNKSNTSNEVPGFGANSSIHELFGKMVWKKMEGIRDDAVIDRLQNRIMNLIHEALAQQNEQSNGSELNFRYSIICHEAEDPTRTRPQRTTSREISDPTNYEACISHTPMADTEGGAAAVTTDSSLNATIKQEQSTGQRNGGTVKVEDVSTVRDDPDKEKKSQADDIIANVTEKFFPGAKRAAEPIPPMHSAPPFMPAPPGMPGIPPPPFMIPPAPNAPPKDAKRIKFNDEDSDENELFGKDLRTAKLLYKKLKSIASRKRLEILHVSIMEMVRQAQEEDERERGVVNTASIPAPPPSTN
ncbi:hypothetical protein OSTOST_10666 [Ostertagia ostertagi]